MYIGKIETGRSYKKIIVLFIILSIGLIAFVTYASFSRAKITLTPKEETQVIDFKTRIAKNLEESNEAKPKTLEPELEFPKEDIIVGKVLEEEKEEKRNITDISLKEVDEKAKGKVIIYNNRDKDQPLLPQTQLLSDSGVLFRTDERVVVQAHGTVEVGVTADQPGKQGNIDPTHFTVVKIWKDWQKDFYAESKEPTTGGTRQAKMVTQEVIDKTKDKVAQELYDQIIKGWKEKLTEEEKILEEGKIAEILSFKANIKPDKETDQFDITIKVHLKALAFSEKALYDKAVTKLKAQVGQDKEFLGVNEGSFSYKVENYDLKKDFADLQAHLEGKTVAKISPEIFDKEKLIGKDEFEVKKYFEQFKDISNVQVEFTPFWTRSVPSLKDHIEIIITR